MTLFVIPYKELGHYRLTTLQFLSLTKWHFIQILWFVPNHPSIHIKKSGGIMCQALLRKLRLEQTKSKSRWPLWKLIHRKCHSKTYHNDTNYHITLNTLKTFRVVKHHDIVRYTSISPPFSRRKKREREKNRTCFYLGVWLVGARPKEHSRRDNPSS